MTAKQK